MEIDGEELAQKSVANANTPLRSLLTPTIVIPIANYSILSFLDISLRALLPLFFSTPAYLGGLGLTPAAIGFWLALYGVVDVALQVLLFSKAVDWLGPKRLFIVSVSCFAPVMLLFPIMSWLVHARGTVDHTITVALLSQLTLVAIWDMAFGALRRTYSVRTINPSDGRHYLRVYHSLCSFEEYPWRYQRSWPDYGVNDSRVWASVGDVPLRIFERIQRSSWKRIICHLDHVRWCTVLAGIAVAR